MENNRNINKNILYNSIGNFIYLACQWLITLIVVWTSGYEDAGILSLSMTISNTIYSISSFSMRGFQSSDLKSEYSYSEYFKSRILTYGLALISCIVFVVFINHSIYVKSCIVFYNIFKLSESIVDVFHGEEQKIWRMDIVGISFGIRGILSVLIFSLLMVFTKNILLSFILMGVCIYVFIYLYDFKKFTILIGKLRKVKYKKVFKLLCLCLPLAIYGFISSSVFTFPKYYLEKVFGAEMLGIYSSIFSPVTIIQVAAMFVFNPLITLFAEYYLNREKNKFYKLILKITGIVIIIAIIALIGVNFLGNWGLKLLFGESILKHSYILKDLVIISVLTAFTWFVGNILVSTRKFQILLTSSMISLISAIVFSYMLIPNLGFNGINYTLIISLSIQTLYGLIFGIILINKDFKKIN